MRIHADKKFSNIIYQPELRTIFVTKKGDNYALINTVIWGKFVKKEVFQNALKYIGTEYTDDYNNEIEDAIMALGIFGLAKSYYTMKEIGYLYSYDEKQGRYPKTKIGKCKFNNKLKQFGEFKVCKFMVDKSNNNYIEKSMVIGFMKMFGLDKKLYNIKFDNRHYKILFYIYDKILEWNCWNNEQKYYIIKQKNFAMKSYEKENNLNKAKL